MLVSVIADELPKDKLILRQHLASATQGDKKYLISLSGGCIIIETEKANYSIAIHDILEDIVRKESLEE